MGGLVLPDEEISIIKNICYERNVSLFLDGARVWHVISATGRTLSEILSGFDMVSMCFSKGLGCPVGSILVCSKENEDMVRNLRKQHGGGMRQAGILAAACLYALEHNLPLLQRTHKYARKIAAAVERSPILEIVNSQPDTNIVIAQTPEDRASEIAEALSDLEIGCLDLAPSILRFVTHLSLSDRAVKYAADVLSAFGG